MDTSSSSCFYTAKEEESPSTVVDAVAELEALAMEESEGASACRKSEYYSVRCEAMMRRRGQFSDAVAMEIEFSKPHRSEVNRRDVAPQSAEEVELNRENREVFAQLWKEHPSLFWHDLDDYVLGRMIAEGGQAQIYEVEGRPTRVLKVFKRGTSLRALRGSCPLPVLNKAVRQCILFAGLLEDGRFAFLMHRYWGDLRKLIDQAMQEKNGHGISSPPFPYKWKDFNKWTFYHVDFMLEIAEDMRDLHDKGVSHRDLKASNILLLKNFGLEGLAKRTGIVVSDFECSIGVLGTGFWRAPEILASLGKQETITNEQWKKADVYSYGMTCFEIVTGRIPFHGELENTEVDHQLVIDGKRPQLPSDLDVQVKDLITRCWDPNPSLRPTFVEIVHMAKMISTKLCQFRLFGTCDELPPQYRLATMQEVNDYPIAVMKVLPAKKVANVANGFVAYGLKTSSKKQSDAGFKVARLLYEIHS